MMARGGRPLTVSADAVCQVVRTLGKRKGTAPGPDGVPCVFPEALGPKCIYLSAEDLARWCRDMGTAKMPEVWLVSRLAASL